MQLMIIQLLVIFLAFYIGKRYSSWKLGAIFGICMAGFFLVYYVNSETRINDVIPILYTVAICIVML